MPGSDLWPVFEPRPAGPALPVTYRQGLIVSFNPITLENTVTVGGAIMDNLPLLGVGESTLLVPGAVVGIMVIGDGIKTMYITGRIVTPNTADAFDAVALLNSNVVAATVSVQETYTDAVNFGDLATLGPTVNVNVRQTGRLLLICTSQIQWPAPAGAASVGVGGWVSVEFSGANTITPLTASATLLPAFNITIAVAAGVTHTCQVTATQQAVFEGLTPGETQIRMKYRNQVAGNNVDYGRRTLTVIVL
jgi:hypothetical protein